jgi:serine/threonine-protein kinase
MIAPNTIVGGRYRVIRVLGGGGMKMVYLAEDLRLAARYCALAEMVDSLTSPEAQQQAVAAFQREADMLARLGNEHIPRVFDRFSEANHHYLVMEYIEGVTLEDELKKNGGKLAPSAVVDIAIQILETLEYLHGLTPPVIYRDLKPSNVMLTADGRAKLIDFGIARHFAPLSNATMIGTQGYAPPEQYRGKVEIRSDLYALGATMHHALSGRDPAAEPPFSFPPLRKISPELDPALTLLVDQALAYDVASRIPGATQFKQRLIDYRDGGRGTAAQSPAPAGKPQLKLPLEANSAAASESAASHAAVDPQQQRSASAPTVIAANPEIRCATCTRAVPADSRFCSFCGATLRASSAAAAIANDATVILSPTPEGVKRASSSERSPIRRRKARSGGLRRPVLLLFLIFAAAFVTMRLLARSMTSDSAPAYRAPAYAPHADSLPPMMRMRLFAFRQALNESGYGSVQFQVVGNTIVLWGNVPNEAAREIVQQMCFGITGVDLVRNNLHIVNPDNTG